MFRVYLNLLREPLIASPEGADRGVTPSKSLRLLLVDDHTDTRLVLSRLLTKCGHEVATTESVQGALKALERGHFDALISDIGLPDGSGYDLAREVKPRHPLKLVALAGSAPRKISASASKQDLITISPSLST